jgi:hypothetical protein
MVLVYNKPRSANEKVVFPTRIKWSSTSISISVTA